MRAESPAGRSGDFLTAPETHPVFGATIGRVIDEAWVRLGSPEPFVIREYGPGSGALAVSILRGLDETGSGLTGAVRYEPIEIATRRGARVRARLVEAGFERQLAALAGAVRRGRAGQRIPRCTARSIGSSARWRGLEELYVIRDGGTFAEQPGPPSTPALAARLAELAPTGVALAEGQRAEICLGLEPWLGEVSAALERGIAIVVDYMLPAAALYGPTRTRRDAPRLRRPASPRRSVPAHRSPGPDRARRPDVAGAGGRVGGPRRPRCAEPGGIPRRCRTGGSCRGDPPPAGCDHRGGPRAARRPGAAARSARDRRVPRRGPRSRHARRTAAGGAPVPAAGTFRGAVDRWSLNRHSRSERPLPGRTPPRSPLRRPLARIELRGRSTRRPRIAPIPGGPRHSSCAGRRPRPVRPE